jgi:short-subunit dehydrogenase|tara:strand:- start:1221 stop:2036 length:816 start_codon:yes stop_codon:yes gene_type:complete
MDVLGKRILITGASRGIGQCMARTFSRAGAHVILVARTTSRIEPLAKELDGAYYTLDLANDSEIDGFINRVEMQEGPIDVLINNAGVETGSLLEDLPEPEISKLITTNLLSPQRLTRQVLPGMISRGTGHLVFTSSVAAITPTPGLAVYCASKAGLSKFAESLRIEINKTGIGVTVLHLGPVDTDMWTRVADNSVFQLAQKRFKNLNTLKSVSPDLVAEDTLKAVIRNRREVRHPKRFSGLMALNAIPGRITETLLAGINFRPNTNDENTR